jgi:hypothetical protein
MNEKVKGRRIKRHIDELRSSVTQIYESKKNKELKNEIEFENYYYFILNLFEKVTWSSTYDKIKNLPFSIIEIMDEFKIKVKLEKSDYEIFYNSLEDLNELIKDIKQVEIWNKISPELFNEIDKNGEDLGVYTIELYDINKDEAQEEFNTSLENYIIRKNGEFLKIHDSEYETLYQIQIINRELIKITETLDSITRVEKEPDITLNIDKTEKLDFLETDIIKHDEE